MAATRSAAPRSQLHAPFFALFLAAVAAVLCHAGVHAFQNLTFEGCSVKFDCLGGGLPIPESLCVGRDSDKQLVECPNDDVQFCICYPTRGFRYCDNNDDCPDETYCGISTVTGNQLCLGCKAFGDPRLNNSAVEQEDTIARCRPNGSAVSVRSPPGLGYDYCSVTMPCSPGYECLSFIERKPVGCTIDSTFCQCFRVTKNKEAALLPCNETVGCESDPTNDRVSCIWNVNTNVNFCMSCDAPRHSLFLIANDTTSISGGLSPKKKCEEATPRPNPSNYVQGPNGRTFDACTEDAECLGERKCMAFSSGPSDPTNVKPCTVDSDFCFCRATTLQKCRRPRDCPVGESCATTDMLEVTSSCVSNALLDIISANQYQLIGTEKVLPVGRNKSWDECKFDWDCEAPRRCTALDDQFGGCSGRGSCTCRMLYDNLCSSTADCDQGEACVNYVDGHTSPFCVSRNVIPLYSYIAPVWQLRRSIAPTPLPINGAGGLNEDPCLSDDDCVNDRICRHVTEGGYRSSCAGRRQCRCGRLSPVESQCNATKDCDPGEVCAHNKDQVPLVRKCVSVAVFDAEPRPFRAENGVRYTPSPTPSVSVTASTSPSLRASPSASVTSSVTSSVTPSVSLSASGTPTPSLSSSASVTPPVTPSASASEMPLASEDAAETDAAETDDDEDEGDDDLISEEPSEICVDVRLLQHLGREQLVFAEDRRAAVLCDRDGSCATPGHMVELDRVGMSMRTYCSRADGGCSRRVMKVNSPRMGAGVRIASRTARLAMSALAARHETWLEEAVLKQVLRWM